MTPAQRDTLHQAMRRLADGERDAFDPVYALLWPLVRRFTMRALDGASEAEDVAQEVLLRVFEQAADFDPDRGDAAAWAVSIAAWQCRTELKRRARRREERGEVLDSVSTLPGPEAQAMESEMLDAARAALDTLRPADVETIRARLEGRAIQVSGATARKRVQRAFARLRGAFWGRYGAQ